MTRFRGIIVEGSSRRTLTAVCASTIAMPWPMSAVVAFFFLVWTPVYLQAANENKMLPPKYVEDASTSFLFGPSADYHQAVHQRIMDGRIDALNCRTAAGTATDLSTRDLYQDSVQGEQIQSDFQFSLHDCEIRLHYSTPKGMFQPEAGLCAYVFMNEHLVGVSNKTSDSISFPSAFPNGVYMIVVAIIRDGVLIAHSQIEKEWQLEVFSLLCVHDAAFIEKDLDGAGIKLHKAMTEFNLDPTQGSTNILPFAFIARNSVGSLAVTLREQSRLEHQQFTSPTLGIGHRRNMDFMHEFGSAREAIGLPATMQLTATSVVKFLTSMGVSFPTKTLANYGAGKMQDDTYQLIRDGWEGYFFDFNLTRVPEFLDSTELQRCNLVEDEITVHTARQNAIQAFGEGIDYIKVDIDSFDCQLIDAVLAVVPNGSKPLFVTIEYSRAYPPPLKYTALWSPTGSYHFCGDYRVNWFGCSAGMQQEIMNGHGYTLIQLGGPRGSAGYPDDMVGWPSGPDALWVRDDIAIHFGDIAHDAWTRWVLDYYWRGGAADYYFQDPAETRDLLSLPDEYLLHRMYSKLVSRMEKPGDCPFSLSL